MARAKLDLKRAKVQTILQLEDPAQRYAWERLEEMRKKGTLQPFLRRITTEALPMPAQPKAPAALTRPAPKPGRITEYKSIDDE